MRTLRLPVLRAGGAGGPLLALALIGLGVVGLAVGDFPYVWQGVAAWLPARGEWALAAGALLVAASLGLFFERAALRSALVLALYLVAACLVLRIPAIAAAPRQTVAWGNLGELACLAAATWILALGLGAPSWAGVRSARVVFALALLSFGVEHFVYAAYTATLVPAWMPAPMAWVYFAGAAHVAAALAILVGLWPRLAAALWALMLSLFTVLVWLPRVAAPHANRGTWTEFLVSWAIASAGWIVAHSYRGAR